MTMIDGDILYDDDLYAMAKVTIFNGIQAKQRELADSGTVISYDNAWIETFNTSTGDDSSVDSGSTTAHYIDKNYVKDMTTIYDDFDDNSFDDAKWTRGTSGTDGTVTEASQRLSVLTNATSGNSYASVTSDTNITYGIKFFAGTVNADPSGNSECRFYIGGIEVLNQTDGSGDFSSGTYEVYINPSGSAIVQRNGTLYKTVSVSGQTYTPKWYCYSANSAAARATITVDDVYIDGYSTTDEIVHSGTILSTSSTIQTILVSAHKNTPSNTAIKYLASADGGANWSGTTNLDIATEPTGGTELVVKLVLQTTNGTYTPELKDYGAMVWF